MWRWIQAAVLLALAGAMGINALDAASAYKAGEEWLFLGDIPVSPSGAVQFAWALGIGAVVLVLAVLVTTIGSRKTAPTR